MARGDRREPIVYNDGDREAFVETLGDACLRGRWEVFARVLMDNHYHLALRTPKPNLVDGMRWFQNAFTRRINTRNRLWGHHFGGRYKSILVEPDSGRGDYLTALIDYIHLNPVRAGLVDGVETSLLDYPWSSELFKSHDRREADPILSEAERYFGESIEELRKPKYGI